MDLYTAGHRRGVVAAPHHAAVETGRAVLAEGGNALEAMVAMAAMIAVVYPHMAQLGGDGFWLVREPSGRVRALMAAGRSGADARRERYRDYETIPPRGALSARARPVGRPGHAPGRAEMAGGCWRVRGQARTADACGFAIYLLPRSPMQKPAQS